ncbi:MAG: hypothetical protein SA339_01880 [Methanomassiliicoccus sp.]|nr:hypothetical protein [Methanomassiliicoccus sp.]
MAMHAGNGPAALLTNWVRLRPLEARDADAVFTFKSDPQVTSCYVHGPYPPWSAPGSG